MEIKFIKMEKILKDPFQYYAHKKEQESGGQRLETLEEHTLLCQKYFKCIYQNKQIGEAVSLFIRKYMKKFSGKLSEKSRQLIADMWCNVVTFHDVGKHNPNFQRDVMGRKEVERNPNYSPAGSEHSALSAVLYLNYYYKKLKNEELEEGRYLFYLLMCNAYTISRHHGRLVSLEEFVRSLSEGRNRKLFKVLQKESGNVCEEKFELSENMITKMINMVDKVGKNQTKEQAIWLYFYEKLTYSMLVAADYYAASEFMSGIQMQDLGEVDNISEIFQVHQSTEVNQGIRKYEAEEYPVDLEKLEKETKINVLRNEIFLDAERQLLKEKEKNIFYLEAPTGSGKSNISMNLSFQLAMQDSRLKKIYYIYPFNTLVEQNQEILKKVFEGHPEMMEQIAVVNSITPIKCVRKGREKDEQNEGEVYYEKALLNRQFLNYPIILTTHVSLFDTIFGDSKASAFGFHQLAGSILVLDEIQSYKNSIWGEIITFLSELAEFLHMKIIIMSATLPDLEILKEKSESTAYLVKNRKKYFCHPCFQKRVEVSRELLEKKIMMEELYQHVKKNCGKGKKLLIEFITKSHAEEFYNKLKTDNEIEETVLCMSGDDSILERKSIIEQISEKGKAVILVATQVIEAGVDIDMDIGYKNIAKMDSEEQFLGRINRSYTSGRTGTVYFFEIDEPKKIYKSDMRSEWEFSVKQSSIWKMLVEKDFGLYYALILKVWDRNNRRIMEKDFFKKQVGELKFPEVCQHMKLIEEQNWNMQVYLGRKIEDENGESLDGNKLWEEYRELLENMDMGYAQKRVRLSEIRAKMNCFIYEIKQNSQIVYNDQIGELFYIEDGEKYFENGRLNRGKIQGQIGEFVDFI